MGIVAGKEEGGDAECVDGRMVGDGEGSVEGKCAFIEELIVGALDGALDGALEGADDGARDG